MIERIPIADISIGERSLGDLEAVIERGLTTFVDVGAALLEIRDRRLYRETHGDFDSYCRERWRFDRRRAAALIGAAEIVGQLSEISDIPPPTRESHAAELARYDDPEIAAQVWRSAVEQHGEKVTAANIRAMRSEESPPYDPPLLSVVDLETDEIISTVEDRSVPAETIEPWPDGIPDIQAIPKEASIFQQLVRMSTVTQDDPEAIVNAALRYHASSARNYLERAETILSWHARFVDTLRRQLDAPIRAIK